MDVTVTPTDVIVAAASSITAAMALLTGIVAVISLRSVRRDSRQRSRPTMLARFQAAVLTDGIIELVIENRGGSSARQVTVGFSPQLPDSGTMAPFMTRRYQRPVAVVAADEALINVYGKLADGGKPGEFDEDVPTEVEVTFAYCDDDGRQYSDSFNLDAAVVADLTRANRGLHSEADKLKLQAQALEAIAKAIGRP